MILLLMVTEASAQNVTFFSSEFEEGVKRHLCLDENTNVVQQQTDTITEIDFSGMGIKDIRDIVYLPNIKTLDLSYNEIRDVSPLLPLDSLHNVDLRNNLLEDISELAFANSDSMVVNVAYNYITDFSSFYLPSNCDIRIVGMAAQKDRDAKYMDVYLFFADVENGQSVVNYRGYSNIEGGISLDCSNTHVSAIMDGNYKTVKISDEMASTIRATLSNGEKICETYVIPPSIHIVQDGKEVIINTELPESYQIGYLRALHGAVEADGATLHYVAPSPIVVDTLYMSYYEKNRIKGFAQMYFMSQGFHDGIKTLQQDSPLEMSLHDGALHITASSTQRDGLTTVKIYDAMGHALAMRTFDNRQDAVIQLLTNPGVIIVEATYAGRDFVTKVAAY